MAVEKTEESQDCFTSRLRKMLCQIALSASFRAADLTLRSLVMSVCQA